MTPPATLERPVSGLALLVLTTSAVAGVLLGYLYCFVALVTMGALVLIELALILALARIGLAGFMLEMIQAHTRLLALVARSLGLRQPTEYQMPLQREDAPRLFALIEQMSQRLGVPTPEHTVLELGTGAWVRLHGYQRGVGRVILGIGYELLALLSEGELKAVLAHEMAHARLIQRGVKGWLANGLIRMGQLAHALDGAIDAAREQGGRFFTAALLARGVHLLGRMERRLFASCCRQDEFAADGLAAELCGADVFRRMLLRIEVAGIRFQELSWRECRARLQRDESFTAWLNGQLAPSDEERAELEQAVLAASRQEEFDAHPSLADRLAALPVASAPAAVSPPALDLLPEPDALAERLVSTLEQIAHEEEQRESERLRREVRKRQRGQHLTPVQTVGIILAILGVAFTCMSLAFVAETPDGWATSVPWLIGSLVVLLLGLHLYRRSHYRERVELPVPRFSAWKAAMEPSARGAITEGHLDTLTAELRGTVPPSVKERKATARFWGDECYRALEQCDYAGALVRSRLSLEADPYCLEGLLGGGIALTYFGAAEGSDQVLDVSYRRFGVGASVGWALGWAFLMRGDWTNGEPYLLDAVTRRPQEPTLWSLLGLAQWQQGKLHEAERSLRQATALEPTEVEHGTSLAQVLLWAGRPKDALQELERLEQQSPTDYNVMLCRIGAELHLGRGEQAAAHAAALEAAHPGPKTVCHLGQAYLDAKQDQIGRDYLERVSREGFYPRALVCLAHLAVGRKEYDRARADLLAALDLTRPLGPEAEGPLELLEEVCQALATMAEPINDASAWAAVLNLPSGLTQWQRLGLLVHAASLEGAREQVRELYEAMIPGQELAEDQVSWQPQGRVEERMPPGIHGCAIE
jgi:Zn-dependent protease with chaperone function